MSLKFGAKIMTCISYGQFENKFTLRKYRCSFLVA